MIQSYCEYAHETSGSTTINSILTFGMRDGELLQLFIDNQKLSKKSIAEDLSISRRTLYQYFDSSTLTPEIKKRFEDYFKAEIFKDHPPASYIEKRRNHKLNHVKEDDISVYQAGTKGSFIDLYEDENTEVTIGSLNSSIFPGCNLALKVTGSSMYPMIVNQSVIVGERLTDYKGISSGEIYAVHTNRGLKTCKYVHILDSKPDHIKLVALSKSVPPQTIPVEDITLIMRVYFIINPS
jgi:phage repressor protein C with HTH and peptisase S24 domain